MKRLKLIVSVTILVIIVAAVVVNWKVVDFYTPTVEWLKKAVESKTPTEPEQADKAFLVPHRAPTQAEFQNYFGYHPCIGSLITNQSFLFIYFTQILYILKINEKPI